MKFSILWEKEQNGYTRHKIVSGQIKGDKY